MSERPLECSHCKKCGDVLYTEMVGETMTTFEMCRDCPVLKQKLEGKNGAIGDEGIRCSRCDTSLESVLMGEPLGCQECYLVFQDVLTDQLNETQLLSPRLKQNPARPIPIFHMGKSPAHSENPELDSRLRDLNLALGDALKGENYEEAAWLRDQINSLTKATDESP